MNFMLLRKLISHLPAERLALLAVVSFLSMAGCQRYEDLGPVADVSASMKMREAFSSGSDDTSASAGPAATGTGWATIKGRFVYDGEPPAMEPYNVNKDQATCSPGGETPLQETLLVDSSTKGIANIAVYLRKASRVHESAMTNTDTVLFDQKDCVFLSHVFPVMVGQKMEIKNSDPVGHNTNIVGKKNTFNQTVADNASIVYEPKKEESVPAPVSCSIHPWMKAYLLPRSNGYFDLTSTDGTFEIPNVPAGEELEFWIWHESAGGKPGTLDVKTDEAKQLGLKKGKLKITLAENEEKVVELTIPPVAFGR